MECLKDIDVLVTGAAGFIGSHLTRRLVKEGARVNALLRKEEDIKNIEDLKDKICIHYGDLTDYHSLGRITKKIQPDKIYHLAAFVDVSRTLSNIYKIVSVNVLGTMNLLRSLDAIDYNCFINTGTCEEYGNIPAPFRETQEVSPVSPYSASKASTTLFCSMYHKTLGAPIVTLRPFLTYGPCQDTKMFIPSLIVSALLKREFKTSPGEQSREFNYVSDIVDGFVKASTTKRAIGEIINIGNGKEYKLKDVMKILLDLMRNPIKPEIGALPYRKNEIMHLFCDNTKAKRLLGWEPNIPLREGLEKTIKWYRENFV